MFTTNIRSYEVSNYMKFGHQISGGTYLPHIGPETDGFYCFYCTTLRFERKSPKTGTMH